MTFSALIASTFPGIASSSPEMLAPLFMIVAAFSLSGLIGIGIVIRDWIMRRS
jgi:hypothetical protein